MSAGLGGVPPITDEEVGEMMCQVLVDGVAWLKHGVTPAYTVTTSSARAEDWRLSEWQEQTARQDWVKVQARARVREACAEVLERLEGLPAARAGRPVTAVALVLGLRK